MTTKSRKAKGRVLQNLVKDKLLKYYPSLGAEDVRTAIMGTSGLDVILSSRAKELFPFGVECKSRATFNSNYEFYKQAETNARRQELIPLVVIKANREKPLVMLDLDEFLDIISYYVERHKHDNA